MQIESSPTCGKLFPVAPYTAFRFYYYIRYMTVVPFLGIAPTPEVLPMRRVFGMPQVAVLLSPLLWARRYLLHRDPSSSLANPASVNVDT